MEPEMKSAWLRTGMKLGIGLALIAAVIGIRMITATPDGIESGIAELERLDSQLAAEAAPSAAEKAATASDSDDEGASIVSRLSGGMLGSDSGSRDGDKLVSCRVNGATQFMRADDCAMRGGESTLFDRPR